MSGFVFFDRNRDGNPGRDRAGDRRRGRHPPRRQWRRGRHRDHRAGRHLLVPRPAGGQLHRHRDPAGRLRRLADRAVHAELAPGHPPRGRGSDRPELRRHLRHRLGPGLHRREQGRHPEPGRTRHRRRRPNPAEQRRHPGRHDDDRRERRLRVHRPAGGVVQPHRGAAGRLRRRGHRRRPARRHRGERHAHHRRAARPGRPVAAKRLRRTRHWRRHRRRVHRPQQERRPRPG